MSNEENKEVKVVLEGVGEDAEIVTNENGGMQSKTIAALYLLDPNFIYNIVCELLTNYDRIAFDDEARGMNLPFPYDYREALMCIKYISAGMAIQSDMKEWLLRAIKILEEDHLNALVRIGKVLQFGAEKYAPNNWRLIPEESHINHALIHLVAYCMGDTQDDHLEHALCRIMMAYATKKSEGFEYNEYIKPKKEGNQ